MIIKMKKRNPTLLIDISSQSFYLKDKNIFKPNSFLTLKSNAMRLRSRRITTDECDNHIMYVWLN